MLIKKKGNTFDYVKYNEDFEIWAMLENKTYSREFNLNPSVTLENGQVVNIPMSAISVEEVTSEEFDRFGTSNRKQFT